MTSKTSLERTHHLYGLWYVHFVDFHMWDSSSHHVLKVLLISVKQVRGINAHTNRSLPITQDVNIWRLCQFTTCTIWTSRFMTFYVTLTSIWGLLSSREHTLGLVLCWSLLSSRSLWRRSYSSRISAGVLFLSTTWSKKIWLGCKVNGAFGCFRGCRWKLQKKELSPVFHTHVNIY